jgi:hypothetical protein
MNMKKATPWIVLLVIIAAGAGWYFYRQEAPEQHPSVVTLPPPQMVAEEPPPATYPVEEIQLAEEPAPDPLPALADSDEVMVEAMATLLGPEAIGGVFRLEQMIGRMVTTIDALDSRQLSSLVLPVEPATGSFQVLGGDLLTIHSDNAQRYDRYIALASALDAQAAVDVYVRFYPLFQQAYVELGYPDRHFNDRLVEIIDHLLATPVPDSPPALIKPEAVYLFEDEDLEALSAGQKLLIRMGERNAGVMKTRLREIRAALTRG